MEKHRAPSFQFTGILGESHAYLLWYLPALIVHNNSNCHFSMKPELK